MGNYPTKILALDVKGVFNNVNHTAVLQRLNTLCCGVRVYYYIRDLLSKRKAILKVGDQAPNTFVLDGRGTPQDAMLSPPLLNIALVGIPHLLDNILGIRLHRYADGITIWSSTGSIGAMEIRLQEAAYVVSGHAFMRPRLCPQKS
ncbi:hypothetical protein HPB49_017439 [Dermacentor silvarum]|uniref:Uncharacterized protein n=1 Tax=Dermacentor silvarum TaxID=543639 RepID=A0ACB8CGE0_DERSI|nr:hypothetical protein HPB49_017439 [Dermacentor silvarum]